MKIEFPPPIFRKPLGKKPVLKWDRERGLRVEHEETEFTFPPTLLSIEFFKKEKRERGKGGSSYGNQMPD